MTKVISDHQRVSSSGMVINKLQGMIFSKKLEPGDKLPPERDLAREFEVSRPTVRGAIQTLVSIGVLRSIQGSGTFVTREEDLPALDSNPFQLLAKLNGFTGREIFEARINLETVIAGLAAENATGEDLAGLAEELVEMFSKIDSPDEYLIHDIKFHQKIAAASQNRILTAMLNMLVSILFENVNPESDMTLNILATTKSYQEIYRAIRSKNSKAAQQLVRDHLSNKRCQELAV